MNDLQLRVIISAVSDNLRNGLRNARDQLNELGNAGARAATQLRASFNSAMGSMQGAIGSLGLGVLAHDILQTNREMESLRVQMVSVTGSMQKGEQAFNDMLQLATDTPFEIKELSKSYIMLKNFGIEPTAQVMNALTNQASKLGASSETLSGITLALGQAWSKGKLQAEEINQMVERGVPVYQLLAEATGKNTAELQDMAQKGQLTTEVIDKLIAKMGEMATGSNARAMETLNGKISILSDSWHKFEDTILNDKSEGFIKRVVGNWAAWLDYLSDKISDTGGQLQQLDALNRQIAQRKTTIQFFQESPIKAGVLGFLTGTGEQGEKNRLGVDLAARQKLIEAIHDENTKKREQAKLDADALARTKELASQSVKLTAGSTARAPKTGSRGGSSAPRAEVSDIGRFETELTAQKLAFERQNLNLEYSKAQELKYWQDLIASYSGNSKTLENMKKRAADVELQVLRETAQLKAEAAKEAAETAQALALEEIDAKEIAANAQVQIRIDEAEQLLALGDISNSDLLARQKAFEDERYQIALKAARDRAGLIGSDDTVGKARALNQEKQLGQQHAADMRAINSRMALDSKEQFTNAFAPIKSAFGSTIQGIIQGTTTLKQGLRNVFQSIAVSYAGSLASMALDAAAHWAWELLGFGAKETAKTTLKVTSETAQTGAALAGEATRGAAEEAGSLKSIAITAFTSMKKIAAYAAEAAAAAYSAMAGIPIIGPVLGAIAAGVTFAAVLAFGGLVSSAGGDWDVGSDRLNLVHKKETILPASIAAPLRDMIAKNSDGSTYTIPGQAMTMANPVGSGLQTTAAGTLAAQMASSQAQQKQGKKSGATIVLNTSGGDFVHKNDVVGLLQREHRNFRVV